MIHFMDYRFFKAVSNIVLCFSKHFVNVFNRFPTEYIFVQHE